MKTMNDYCREKFGIKLYKLSLDGGFTCPNRDGTKGVGGCIFCSSHGSGDFAVSGNDIYCQLERAKRKVAHKNKNGGYIAYFQSFTSTYAPYERLRELFTEAINHPDVYVLSVATRPDCLPDETIELLGQLNKIKPVWVELGLQTSNEKTAEFIGRCYENREYESAVRRLHEKGIYVITHMIAGLSGEDINDIKNTLQFIINNKSDGIKIQLLHILRDSRLYDEYIKGNVKALSKQEYLEIIYELLPLIPENTHVHRITGDGDKKTLVAPLWSGDKKAVLNSINALIKLSEGKNGFVFRKIRKEELPRMFEIILSRMRWMDEKGIKQWNVTEYDTVYPLSYYEEHYNKGEVFVLCEKTSDKIVAAAVLRRDDERWEHIDDYKDKDAFYLHNFASAVGEKGVGELFLSMAEEYARILGKDCFRLDSADDNIFLRDYYTEKGYEERGYCIDGMYSGVLREKMLNK